MRDPVEPQHPVAPQHSATQDCPARHRRRRWVFLTLIALAIQVIGLYAPASGEPLITSPPHTDKVFHAASFAAVTACAVLARFPMRFVVPLMLVHAVASELIQWRLIESRSGDIADLIADGLGVAAGVLAARLWQRHVTRRG